MVVIGVTTTESVVTQQTDREDIPNQADRTINADPLALEVLAQGIK